MVTLSLLVILLSIPVSIGPALRKQELRGRTEVQTIPAEVDLMISKINDTNLQIQLRSYLNSNPSVISGVQKISVAYKGLKNAPTPKYGCGEINSGSGCASLSATKTQTKTTSTFNECLPGGNNFVCGLQSVDNTKFGNVFNCRNDISWNEDTYNWRGDWDAVNDATSFAPSLLYRCAAGTSPVNAAELTRRADKTVNYELSLIDQVINGSIGVSKSDGTCWIFGANSASCNNECTNRGGICSGVGDPPQWNDDTQCSTSKLLPGGCSSCISSPAKTFDSPRKKGSGCEYRPNGTAVSCSYSTDSNYQRLCSCMIASATPLPGGYCLAPNYEVVGKMLGGANSLIAARTYYVGPRKQDVELYSRAMAIGATLALIYDPTLALKSPMGAVLGISGVAYYNLSLAEISSGLEQQVYTLLGKYLLQNIMEPYWKEDTYGGYYKSLSEFNGEPLIGPVTFEQGMPLVAGAKLWKLDTASQSLILTKLRKALPTHNKLWDSVNSGFWEGVEGKPKLVKMLSSNHLIMRGLILLYNEMRSSYPGEASFMKDRAELIKNFVTKNLYKEYQGSWPGPPSDVFFRHDTATQNTYCTGCNFAMLDNLNLLWAALVTPTPTLPTCDEKCLNLHNRDTAYTGACHEENWNPGSQWYLGHTICGHLVPPGGPTTDANRCFQRQFQTPKEIIDRSEVNNCSADKVCHCFTCREVSASACAPTPTPTLRPLHNVDQPQANGYYTGPFEFAGWSGGGGITRVEMYMDKPKGQVGEYGRAPNNVFRQDLADNPALAPYKNFGWKFYNPAWDRGGWLTPGWHTIYVYAVDNNGNTIAGPIERRFLVATAVSGTPTPTPTHAPI